MTSHDIPALAKEYADKHPKEILQLAIDLIGTNDLAISFSGAEDVVLIEMAWKLNKNIRVFSLDTGRLHPETYRFIEKVRQHYGINIELMSPDAEQLQSFVAKNGLYSFYENTHHDCCAIRKTEPLSRKLQTLNGWVTGQRKDQSPSTRNDIAVIEIDETFKGAGNDTGKPLLKFNPLANWTSQQVWEYIRMFDVPYNPLHEQGYISIGCEPCTKPVGPNQHEREGRWWWEEDTAKECGLHIGNLTKPEV